MKKPMVSIITPCYNGENFVHRYFESILSQTYDNIELIFVNDGSTDNTESIVLSYKEKLESRGISVTYIYQKNAGQASAINKALKLFKGDYLTWPDSDDWMSDDCIEKKVSFLESHPEYAMVMCRTGMVLETDLSTCVSYRERKNTDKHDMFEDLITTNDVYFAPGGYMVRSDAFTETVPEKSIFCGNTGQNMQLLLPVAYNRKCGFMPDVLYYYLVRDNSHSKLSKTPQQIYDNLHGNENTIIQTLNLMDIPEDERARYIQLAKYSWAKKRFYAAIEFKETKAVALFFKEIKSAGRPNLKLRIQHTVFKSKILNGVFRVFKR